MRHRRVFWRRWAGRAVDWPAGATHQVETVPSGSGPAPDPAAVGTAPLDEAAQDQVRKYGAESRYRIQLGPWKWVATPLAVALTLFQLYTGLFGAYTSLIQGAVHVGGAMGLIFLFYPARRAGAERRGVAWYDVLLAAGALWTNFYIVVNYERLVSRSVVIGFSNLDYTVAALGILLVLEGTRRCVGAPIVVVAAAAIVYNIFGQYMPIFTHPGYSWRQYAAETFFSSNAIFGIPIQVSSTFIFLFLLFGVLLVRTNIGAFFNDLAFTLTGRYTGGTAKAAAVASGLQGMVSGSSVANTVASGSFTIPMMKRSGFRSTFAGASEAAASTGGQLMPPVMGAAAFIMAEYTGVPYSKLILIAVIPVLLYYSGLFMGIHFRARRRGILGLPRDELPSVKGLLTRLDLLLPLATIFGLLLRGHSPAYAALWAIAVAFVLSLVRKDTRLSITGTVRMLEGGARTALPVIAACATAGIVAGTVTKTGLGGELAGGVLDLAFGQFFLVLVFTMIACLILGMGLPTTANYVVTATVAAPILLQFDVPLIAGHMFVFYFGILADITPPVCLAAYAGAGIAGANPLRTGVTAFRLAIAGFIVPYVFVLEPSLLLQDVTVSALLPTLATVLLGMMAISAGLMGYLVDEATVVERVILVAAGLVLVYPHLITSACGVALLALIAIVQWPRRHRRVQA